MSKKATIILLALLLPALSWANKSDSMKAINQAKVLIETAERNDASKYAPYLLKSSRDQLAKAQLRVEDREWVDAEIAAKMAQRDAEVADAKSRAMKAEKSYQDLKAVVDLLKNELQHKRSMQ